VTKKNLSLEDLFFFYFHATDTKMLSPELTHVAQSIYKGVRKAGLGLNPPLELDILQKL